MAKVVPLLELNQRETNYFEALVELSRNRKNNLLSTSLVRMISVLKPKDSQLQISKTSFSLISKPIYFILREMVKLKNFKFDPKIIKDKLSIPASEEEISQAFEVLVKVGLLNFQDSKFSQSVDFFETTTDIPSSDLREYHKECLKSASKIIDTVEISKRHIVSDTIAMKLEDVERLKNLIEAFRKEVTAQYDITEGDAVYQFNVQLLPMTKV